MNNYWFVTSALLLSALFNVPFVTASTEEGLVQDKPTITWLVEDTEENLALLRYPNLSPNISSTPASYTEQLVLSKLKNFNIKLQITSLKRLSVEVKKNKNTCAANRLKTTERARFSLYSTPQSIYLGHKLYRLAHRAPLPKALLNEHGEIISLDKLFKYFPDSVLGTGDETSYGKFLDKEIAKIDRKNIYTRGGGQRVFALNEMLLKERIDYSLFYPNEINLITPDKALLENYNIEGSPSYVLSYFICSKSTLGEKVINNINTILAEAYRTQSFYQVYQQWLLPADLATFDGYFFKEFKTLPATHR